jgi:hypothetical protein
MKIYDSMNHNFLPKKSSPTRPSTSEHASYKRQLCITVHKQTPVSQFIKK